MAAVSTASAVVAWVFFRMGFRGVIYDVDPEFANSEEWYNSIPAEIRPRKDQPFYHLLAENAESTYTAYVSEQNLLPDGESGAVRHPQVNDMFVGLKQGRYELRKAELQLAAEFTV